MAPLVVLIVVSCAARITGWLGVSFTDDAAAAIAVGLCVMFLMTGATHFVPSRRAGLVAIVPPAVPAPGLAVTVTGALELLLAVGLLLEPARALCAWALAGLLILLYPANVYAAAERRSPTAPHTSLWPRTGIQIVFVATAVFVALST